MVGLWPMTTRHDTEESVDRIRSRADSGPAPYNGSLYVGATDQSARGATAAVTSVLTSSPTTAAPRFRKLSTHALPMPDAAPVTRTTLPVVAR